VLRLQDSSEAEPTPIDDEDGESPSVDFAPYEAETLDARTAGQVAPPD
jgi:hypothetical protein